MRACNAKRALVLLCFICASAMGRPAAQADEISQVLKPTEQTTPICAGFFSIGEQRIDITHGVAYETITDKELRTIIVLSDQPCAVDELKTILARDHGCDRRFKRPSRFLMLSFECDGEPSSVQVSGRHHVCQMHGWDPTTKMVFKDGIIEGVSRYQKQDGVDVNFDVQFSLKVIPLPQTLKENLPGANLAKTCKGSFSLNGKSFPLSHAVVHPYTNPFGVQFTRVLLTKKPVPMEELKAALSKTDGGELLFHYYEPHLTLDFDSSGKLWVAEAHAENRSAFSQNGTNDEPLVVGSLKNVDGTWAGDGESKRKVIDSIDERRVRLQFSVTYSTAVVLAQPGENTNPPGKQERQLRRPWRFFSK